MNRLSTLEGGSLIYKDEGFKAIHSKKLHKRFVLFYKVFNKN